MLTEQEKDTIRRNKIREYAIKKYTLELEKIALQAAGDEGGVITLDQRIEALQKAIAALEEVKTDADSDTVGSSAETDV